MLSAETLTKGGLHGGLVLVFTGMEAKDHVLHFYFYFLLPGNLYPVETCVRDLKLHTKPFGSDHRE